MPGKRTPEQSKEHNRRRYEKDPEKEKARTKAYLKDHPGVVRKSYLKRTYGLTPDAYDSMLIGQGGVCAGCGSLPPEGKNLFVDHNHTTGEVRGLLCNNCNRAVGNMHDDPNIAATLSEYLRQSL